MSVPIYFGRFSIALLLVLSACAAPTTVGNTEGMPKFEDPDLYAVDSKNYPTYGIESVIYSPPSVMTRGYASSTPIEEIRSTDLWIVTHVYKGYYYIFSGEYQKRQEQLIKNSYSWNVIAERNFYHILIDKAGKIVGWVIFKNKNVVLLRSERRIVFDSSYWRNPEWDKQPGFKPIEK